MADMSKVSEWTGLDLENPILLRSVDSQDHCYLVYTPHDWDGDFDSVFEEVRSNVVNADPMGWNIVDISIVLEDMGFMLVSPEIGPVWDD